MFSARIVVSGLLLLSACSNDSTGNGGTTGGTTGGGVADLAMTMPDLTLNNPQNPAGIGPAPVQLGSSSNVGAAGSYVILAKTGITNVTGSSMTGGNLGLSPAAASFITGFSLIADATNVFATSSSVVTPGRVYAADYADPTPTNLTTAVLGMQAAYSDAASRNHPDHLNLGSGNIGGQTLAPGLYTWGSSVTVPTDVTISGGANDTWIFQISNDLDVSTGVHVLLSGDAQAANIWWQVAGQATLHANAHFEGILLAQTGITLQTMASLHGRVLAQTLVAVDNNAITAP
jgi:Ice-binding-like